MFYFPNLLLGSCGSHWSMFHNSEDLHNCKFTIAHLWICSRTALTGTGPYSTILTTFTNQLEVLNFSFVKSLLGSVGGHRPRFHCSNDLRKLIRIPKLFLYELAAGRVWRTRAHVLLLSRTSQTFGHPIYFLYEFAPGQLRQARTNIPLFWWPSQTY